MSEPTNNHLLHVKSIHTGQNHRIPVPAIRVRLSDNLTKNLVKDERVAPKQNYAHVDTNFVNLNANRGPDK